MEKLNDIWKDQKDFNLNFFPPARCVEEKSRQTKEFVLCIMSELNELLNVIKWKIHRKQSLKLNPEQIKSELTDIFKYYLSLCLVWEVSPENVISDYWRKSMVCRQRYSEEYIKNLEEKIIICDIDGVIADYYTGFLKWVSRNGPSGIKNKALELLKEHQWLNASSLNMHEQVWQDLKHSFRVSRGKVEIPVYREAREFLWKCKNSDYQIILLTSRPINLYPNIYVDTLEWLKFNDLKFDFIWWTQDKKEAILSKSIKEKIVFAVDDDYSYACDYASLGIETYWVNRVNETRTLLSNMVEVSNLNLITERRHL